MKFIKILITILLCMGFSNAADWPNEPAGSTLMGDFGLNAREGNGFRAVYPTGGEIISDPTAPFSAPSVLRYSRSSGTVGNSCNTYLDFADRNELYVGFWWKPSNPFTGWQTGQNKIGLVKNKDVGHFYILMTGPQGGPFNLNVQLDYFTGNAHLGGNGDNPGPRNIFANRGNASIALGVWHRIEFYVKNGTSPTSNNGIMRWWMDGVLQADYNQVNYPGPFWEVMLAPIWDAGIPLPFPEYHSYDHVHVSEPHGAVTPFAITNGSLPTGRTGVSYSATLQATGGKGPYGFTIASGSLPQGLNLNKTTGLISGAPVVPGRSDFTIKALDASVPGLETTKSFTITVSGTSAIAISNPAHIGVGTTGTIANRMAFDIQGRMLVADQKCSGIFIKTGNRFDPKQAQIIRFVR